MERLPAGHCLSEAEPGPWSTDSKPRALVLTPGFLSRAGETPQPVGATAEVPCHFKRDKRKSWFYVQTGKGEARASCTNYTQSAC